MYAKDAKRRQTVDQMVRKVLPKFSVFILFVIIAVAYLVMTYLRN